MDGVSLERIPPPAYETNDVAVAAPPDATTQAQSNLVMRLVPIVTAVVTAGAMAAAYFARSTVVRNPAFVMLPLMMLVSAIATVVSGMDRRRGEINARRADYLEYLSSIRISAKKTAVAQHFSTAWNYPDPDALWTLIGGPRLWERAPTDTDFCEVRIGVGHVPLATRLIEPPMEVPHRFDPVGVSALRRFLNTHSTVANMPITVSLSGSATVTIRGDGGQARALARAMICHLAVMHSPATVVIAAAVSDRSQWEWLKWLPHNRHPSASDDAGPVRMIYPLLAAAHQAVTAPGRHGVVVVDTEERVGDPVSSGVATLVIDRVDGDPITVAVRGETVVAHIDRLSYAGALVCAQRLAGCRVGPGSATSQGMEWQKLVGITDVASLSPAVHRSGGRSGFLRVPLGVDVAGTPVELDIKEAAAGGMGPHGLCIGATGSGKSELLRTVALGMIVGHSSEELNLVLVDFKGGATFSGLEAAPHVAAVITNLADKAALVTRMRDALLGEVNRRQEVLRAAGNLDGIATYHRRRRAGAQLASLPVLFIIVDEFSELLTQHPDFAEVFVAIGRLGRSLGIHLLLASQRLDEGRLRGLESHLSYRICLKTLSSNDSRLVLGTSAAYELPATPGAAYLRAGTDSPVRFQTAFVSAPCATSAAVHEPVRCARPATPPLVRPFTTTPVGPISVGPGEQVPPVEYPTLLQAVVERLTGQGPRAHEVWLPPLSGSPTLDAVLRECDPTAALTAPIGIVDRPFEQRRTPLVVDLSGSAGNVALVGAPQSGKSTALRTLITALAATHDPRLVQFYCLDFGGGSLTALRDWPHVGSVAGRADVERVRNTLSRLGGIVRSRETLFGEHGIASMGQYRQLRAAHDPRCDRFGDVFLVVDGWLSLQRELEVAESWVTSLAAEGLSFGVHVVIAASRWAEIRPALRDQIGTRIELRLGDPSDSEVDRRQAHQVPVRAPGRGLSPDGLHMVVALPRLDGEDVLPRSSGGWAAPPVPVLPARIDLDCIVGQADGVGRGPIIGVEETELEPLTIDFTRQLHLLILGDSECGKTATLRAVCRELMRTSPAAQALLFIVDPRRSLSGVVEPDSGCLGGYFASTDAVTDALPAVVDVLRRRMPGWSGPHIYVVVDDYELLDGAGGNPLAALVEMLPFSRDIGLHLMVARRSGGATRALFEPVLAGIRDAGCATLLMSASPDEGLAIGSVRPAPLPPGRGKLISRRGGDPQMIHVGWTPQP